MKKKKATKSSSDENIVDISWVDDDPFRETSLLGRKRKSVCLIDRFDVLPQESKPKRYVGRSDMAVKSAKPSKSRRRQGSITNMYLSFNCVTSSPSSVSAASFSPHKQKKLTSLDNTDHKVKPLAVTKNSQRKHQRGTKKKNVSRAKKPAGKSRKAAGPGDLDRPSVKKRHYANPEKKSISNEEKNEFYCITFDDNSEERRATSQISPLAGTKLSFSSPL